MHDNAIESLPPEFGDLKNLSNLSLDHNQLSVLPKEFYRLTELRWLGLSHNALKKIEPDFGDLVMLNFLVRTHCYNFIIIYLHKFRYFQVLRHQHAYSVISALLCNVSSALIYLCSSFNTETFHRDHIVTCR